MRWRRRRRRRRKVYRKQWSMIVTSYKGAIKSEWKVCEALFIKVRQGAIEQIVWEKME
jgi:hypothetical protein